MSVVHKLDQITLVWFPAKYPCNPRMVRKSSVLLFCMVIQVLYHFLSMWQMRSDVNLMSRTWMAHNSSSNYLELSCQHLKFKTRSDQRPLPRSSDSLTPVNPLRPDHMGGGSGNETFGTCMCRIWWHSEFGIWVDCTTWPSWVPHKILPSAVPNYGHLYLALTLRLFSNLLPLKFVTLALNKYCTIPLNDFIFRVW